MNFIGTGLRELGLKVRRQRTRMTLRHVRRLLKRSEISLGREGTAQASSFPEVRNEIVALKKLEHEQKEVALRIAQIEEALKKIDAERKENSKAQNDAITALEAQKKPVLQRRDEARAAASVCDRELSSVESRLQSNDAADREILRQLAALQALAPPPDDIEAQRSALASKRVRLPDQRAEISRAREGSADACRVAKHKLGRAEEELSAADKNISRVREEFTAKDRLLNEQARTQNDALKEARAQHQTVEERKDPAYLNIGRHLGTQGIAPPNAPHLLHDVVRNRQAVERHLAHKEELRLLSEEIDKQHLRKFYFSVASILVLLAIILPLVFQTSPRRAWLPGETDAILSLNTERFEKDDFAKRFRAEEFWKTTWPALLGAAAETPRLDLPAEAARLTRGLVSSDSSAVREFDLLETRKDVSPLVRVISEDKAFEQRVISGLPVWQRADFSVARIGPRTLAVGLAAGVDELVRVRLGMTPDLQLSGPLFDRFEALDSDSALRLISRDPPGLERAFHPIFSREFLDRVSIIGLGIALENPIKARVIVRAANADAASSLAEDIKNEPQRWLHLVQSDLNLFVQPPEISRDKENIELRFNMPDNSARLLLQRIARTDTPSGMTAAQ